MIERIKAIAAKSQYKFEIDWGVLERAISTLQKLAPPDLRTPEKFLDDLYECKRILKMVYEKENEIREKELMKIMKPY